MNKGKPMLPRSKKPIQIVIKRLWSISAGVLLLKLLHIFDFWRYRNAIIFIRKLSERLCYET